MKQTIKQQNKPSYKQIMQDLGIPVYNQENTQKCHYNIVTSQKLGLILRSIRKIQQPQSCVTFLRYQEGFYNLQFQKLKSEKMLNSTKKEDFRA